MRSSQNFWSATAMVVCICSGSCSTSLSAAQPLAESVNITVDDTGPFVYLPQGEWHSSIALAHSHQKLAGTWHYTTHVPSLDASMSVNLPATIEFNFTGTAIYLFSSLPLGDTLPSSLVNLTYALDSHYAGNYVHDGSIFAPGFLHSTPTFSKDGLENGLHTFRVAVEPSSAFYFDYVTYTQERPTTSVLATSHLSQNIIRRSSTMSNQSAMSTVAIGASVGVLAVLAVACTLNVYRRRRQPKRRDLEEHEWEQDEYSLDQLQSGQDPAPFVPRYFPGTAPLVIATAPPPYDLRTAQPDALPAAPTPPSYTPRQIDDEQSYANHAPPTPPESVWHGEDAETPPPGAAMTATPPPPPPPPGSTEHDAPQESAATARENATGSANPESDSESATPVPPALAEPSEEP